MTRFARRSLVALAAAVLLVTAAPTAHAGLGEDVMFFEVYGGIYNPELGVLDSSATYGLRLGSTIGTRLAASGTLGYFETDGQISAPVASGPINLNAWLADATIAHLFMPDSRIATLALGGGVGWAFADLDGSSPRTNCASRSRTSSRTPSRCTSWALPRLACRSGST